MTEPEHFTAIVERHFVRLKEITMAQHPQPVDDSADDTIRDLVVAGVRAHGIERDWAVRILTARGFPPAEVEDIVRAAEEAGA